MNKFKFVAFFLCLVCAANSYAHEGHDHGAPENTAAIGGAEIQISAEAKENLGIQTHEVEVVAINETLTALGQIEPIPSRMAAVSSRISGRVSALFVNDGEAVMKGQELVEVESRQLGNPPPRVSYKAPFDGVIIDRHAVLGETVDPDRHLMEIVNLSEVYAECRIYEGQVALLKPEQQARVVVEAFPDEVFIGNVDLISGALEPQTRTLRVWVRLANPELKLRPHMRATVNIVVNEAASALAVPNRAILGDTAEKFVYVESRSDPLTYFRKSVAIGIKDDRFTQIRKGVLKGAKVVTEGAYQLQYVTPVESHKH